MRFQSTPPGWEATLSVRGSDKGGKFQSTPPGWEATFSPSLSQSHHQISIHASRVGGDKRSSVVFRRAWTFQSTPPGWEATAGSFIKPTRTPTFQSTPPPGGRRPYRLRRLQRTRAISIHASRVGGDSRLCDQGRVTPVISIHASRVGGDDVSMGFGASWAGFQSTPPGWRRQWYTGYNRR